MDTPLQLLLLLSLSVFLSLASSWHLTTPLSLFIPSSLFLWTDIFSYYSSFIASLTVLFPPWVNPLLLLAIFKTGPFLSFFLLGLLLHIVKINIHCRKVGLCLNLILVWFLHPPSGSRYTERQWSAESPSIIVTHFLTLPLPQWSPFSFHFYLSHSVCHPLLLTPLLRLTQCGLQPKSIHIELC